MGLNLLKFRAKGAKDIIFLISFGIAIGYLFGIFVFSKSLNIDVIDNIRITKHAKNWKNGETNLNLRCVILIHRNTWKPEMILQVLSDGYTKLCNETIYFSNDQKLIKKMEKKYSIEFIDKPYLSYFYWSFYQFAMEFSAKNSPAQWTFIGNEQTYLIVPNLKRILLEYNSDENIILGKVSSKKSIWTTIFPFTSSKKVSVHSGVVFSNSAIDQLSKCRGFFTPLSAENALYDCSQEYNIEIVDPFDEDSSRLFNDLPPSEIIVPNPSNKNLNNYSDHAITFGQLSINNMRVIEYGMKVKVFGLGEIERVIDNNQVSNNQTSN